MYIRFTLLFILDLIVNLVGYLLINWWVPALADPVGNLPRRLRWFQTHDATLDGVGVGGGIEPRFIRATAWLRGDTGEPKNAACRFLCRVLWLYRNNAYGFAYAVLGAPGPFSLAMWEGNPAATNRAPAVAGECFQVWRSSADGKEYFRYWLVRPWGFGKCLEVSIGWKISANSQRAQLVCRAWPFRSFEQ